MLTNDFFYIESLARAEGQLTAEIRFNAGHSVFEGHFPGQPVVPGVCMLQVIKELLEQALGQKLVMRRADLCKFLSVIDPVKTPGVTVRIDHAMAEELIVNATISRDDIFFLKLKAVFREMPPYA